VWHGTFAFVDRPEGVEVLVPNVSMHAYYAGSWGPGLQELAPGKRFRLSGVKNGNGTAAFNPDEHICVQGLADDYDRFLRCSWEPMVPKRIFTLQRMKLTGRNFSQPVPAAVHIPGRVGLLHVMTFEFDDLASLSVLDVSGGSDQGVKKPLWRPLAPVGAAGRVQANCVVNLHIFADPPNLFEGSMARMNYAHPEMAFGELMRLTQSPELGFRLAKEPFILPDDELPYGVRESEMGTLAESGLLEKRGLASGRNLPPTSASVAAGGIFGATARSAAQVPDEEHARTGRRAFVQRLGLWALLGGVLGQVAPACTPTHNCLSTVVRRPQSQTRSQTQPGTPQTVLTGTPEIALLVAGCQSAALLPRAGAAGGADCGARAAGVLRAASFGIWRIR